jgi:uncharacterized cupredoxin-like copper-binding protein
MALWRPTPPIDRIGEPVNLRAFVVLAPLVLVVAACSGRAAVPSATAAPSEIAAAAPTAQVEVTMTDAMRFEPAALTVKRGAPVTFVVKNAGLIVHEFFVGAEAAQVEHAMEMAMPGMTSHGHRNGLSVKPGETGELTMTFAEAGSQVVGCHEPGHYDAGMSGTITIVD